MYTRKEVNMMFANEFEGMELESTYHYALANNYLKKGDELSFEIHMLLAYGIDIDKNNTFKF
jgi:hypothetical protein